MKHKLKLRYVESTENKQIFFRKERKFHDLLQKNYNFCHDDLAGGNVGWKVWNILVIPPAWGVSSSLLQLHGGQLRQRRGAAGQSSSRAEESSGTGKQWQGRGEQRQRAKTLRALFCSMFTMKSISPRKQCVQAFPVSLHACFWSVRASTAVSQASTDGQSYRVNAPLTSRLWPDQITVT